MHAIDFIQLAVYCAVLLAITKPLGQYLLQLFPIAENAKAPRWIGLIEAPIHRVAGIVPREQTWQQYARSVLAFSVVSVIVLYAILRAQASLPLNPANIPNASDHLAFNTAISFVTNTNWQSYGGEGSMSYFAQMVGLAFQNFVSSAVGLAVAVALVRGLARKTSTSLGNFWVDMTRGTLFLLIPICLVFALVLVSQGMIMNFAGQAEVTTMEGATQTIARGPMASQVAIKMLGTNGGGFMNANASHPYENPTPLSNLLQMLSIFAIPSALTYYLGRGVKNQAHGWSVWTAMLILFLAGVAVAWTAETNINPAFAQLGIDPSTGNMEGKEVRFGIFNSALFAVITTDASCGAVNAMHDSFMPLGGLIPMLNMQLGEVIFGGVGAGLYGMIVFVIVTVFLAGLMIGRTPEYLGKKIEARDVKLAALAILAPALAILGFTGLAVVTAWGQAGMQESGPHGFSEVLYAYSSAAANNGSAFGGLSANAPGYNFTLGLAMLIGRFLIIVPVLALAGHLCTKRIQENSASAFPVSGPIFTALLVGTVVLVAALTFFPALVLGPVLEHVLMFTTT